VTLDETAALAWFDDYLLRYRESWALFDDVLPALDAMERAVPGIWFGIITHDDLGVTKPDPRIFHAAAAPFGVAPTRCTYVGDRVRTNAAGAHHARMLGIWLDRGAARNTITDTAEGTVADVPAEVPCVTRLFALPAHLGRWARAGTRCVYQAFRNSGRAAWRAALHTHLRSLSLSYERRCRRAARTERLVLTALATAATTTCR